MRRKALLAMLLATMLGIAFGTYFIEHSRQSADHARRSEPLLPQPGETMRGEVPLAGYSVEHDGGDTVRVQVWSPYYFSPDSDKHTPCEVIVRLNGPHDAIDFGAYLSWAPVTVGDVEDYEQRCHVEQIKHDQLAVVASFPDLPAALVGNIYTSGPVILCAEVGHCKPISPTPGTAGGKLPELGNTSPNSIPHITSRSIIGKSGFVLSSQPGSSGCLHG